MIRRTIRIVDILPTLKSGGFWLSCALALSVRKRDLPNYAGLTVSMPRVDAPTHIVCAKA